MTIPSSSDSCSRFRRPRASFFRGHPPTGCCELIRPTRLRHSLLEPIKVFGILNLRLETREGCVIAVRVRGCGGSVDERLRRRRRRPVLVGGRGVRVVRRMVAESSRTTQKQTAVTRHGRHVMVMVLVHSPVVILWIMRMPWIRWTLVDFTRMLTLPEGRGEVPHEHRGDIFFRFVVR